jgi:TRAP-type C4-dicarboxylate transport system substrate-binding protein
MWRLYKRGLLGGLDGIKVLGFYSTDIFALHTTRPVKSVFDLGGMKVRAAGRIHGETIRAMGGVPIGIPITQTTESLSRGVVDGVMLGFTGINIFRMLPIVKYHYDVPLGGFPLVIAMNEKAWNGLSPKAKAAYERHSGLEMARNGGGGFDKLRRIFLGKMKKAGGHTFAGLSGADRKKRQATVQPVYDAWIKSVPNGRKKFDVYMKVLADIRAGR